MKKLAICMLGLIVLAASCSKKNDLVKPSESTQDKSSLVAKADTSVRRFDDVKKVHPLSLKIPDSILRKIDTISAHAKADFKARGSRLYGKPIPRFIPLPPMKPIHPKPIFPIPHPVLSQDIPVCDYGDAANNGLTTLQQAAALVLEDGTVLKLNIDFTDLQVQVIPENVYIYSNPYRVTLAQTYTFLTGGWQTYFQDVWGLGCGDLNAAPNGIPLCQIVRGSITYKVNTAMNVYWTNNNASPQLKNVVAIVLL